LREVIQLIKWIQNLDTRDIIALIVVGGFIAATLTLPENTQISSLKEMALLTVGYYFGNKATMDKM